MKLLAASSLSLSILSSAFEFTPPQSLFHRENALATRQALAPFEAPGGTFDQLIDHNNPSLGTFKQRYWYSTEHWTGDNAPIVVNGFGESAINASTTSQSFNNQNKQTTRYAKAIGGAEILIEHRYWGASLPFTDFTNAENLKYHTVDQAIQDLIYFARNVKLPFDSGNGISNAPNSPWVLFGGSYSGALTAWVAISAPGTFWAYHGSSAPLQAIENFWEYETPIKRALPINCTGDLTRVLNYVDATLQSGDETEITTLKTGFGKGGVKDHAKFVQWLAGPIYAWQSNRSKTFKFCDVLEGVTDWQGNYTGNPNPGSEGLGLDQALLNFQSYLTKKVPASSFVGTTTVVSDDLCFSNNDNFCNQIPASDVEIAQIQAADRVSWEWMLCNEPFGWRQTGAFLGDTTLFSRFLNAAFFEETCAKLWPGTQFNFASNSINDKFGGWFPKPASRLMLSSGEVDPWRSAGVHSEHRPGGQLASTDELPNFLIPDGNHCPDLYYDESKGSALLEIMDKEVQQMVTWVDEFYANGGFGVNGTAPPSSTGGSGGSGGNGTGTWTSPTPSATGDKPGNAGRDLVQGSVFIGALAFALLLQI